MTCKENCAHYEVCKILHKLIEINESSKHFSEYSYLSKVEKFCEHFLDKKDVIRLRCEKCKYIKRTYETHDIYDCTFSGGLNAIDLDSYCPFGRKREE